MEDYEHFLELNYSHFNSSWNHSAILQWLRRHYEHDLVPDECFPLLDLLDLFHLYYIPSIILIGLVGNLLSCVVFLNTHLKMRSSSYYLAALATADFGFLATLAMVWLNNNLGVQVFNKDGWCQGLVYLSSVCSFLSVWLIVAFTVERFIAVQYPLHRPHMCTVARAKTVVFSLTLVALLTHSYSFVTAGINGQGVCDLREGYHETMRVINIIDSFLTLIVPLALIIVMNTMITRNLIRFSRRFKQQGASADFNERSDFILHPLHSSSSNNRKAASQESYHSSRGQGSTASQGSQPPSRPGRATHLDLGTGPPPTPTTTFVHSAANKCILSVACRLVRPVSRPGRATHLDLGTGPPPTPTTTFVHSAANKCIHIRSSSRNLASTRTQQSITKMLLLISSVFVLLNLPSYVIRLYVFICFSLWRQTTPDTLWCMQQFFMLLYYTNFSINFLLYSMCGITFRRCLWQLIRNKLKALTRYHCDVMVNR
ncbi:uncharacterized protein LOC128984776 [Macrosteles quadrilineatus]|uniref:uncharacterized protein LOC128984776 n=1 Tax=Macrosteles quadrilineatus TaxID=74068 RepID=UPI0023E30A33|nr:uncharacterized protein LOC128984776 [Macrosteles quadrilineatus]